jgi:hypothetical protein
MCKVCLQSCFLLSLYLKIRGLNTALNKYHVPMMYKHVSISQFVYPRAKRTQTHTRTHLACMLYSPSRSAKHLLPIHIHHKSTRC